MSLDRAVDRILTSEEVRVLLREDCKSENSDIDFLICSWNRILKRSKWSGKKRLPEDKTKVIGYKVESMYVFRSESDREILKPIFPEEACRLVRVPQTSELQGLSIDDLELIVGSFLVESTPITTLLNFGFTLDLVVDNSLLES